MRKKLSKLALTAVLGLAITFTFSCYLDNSSDDTSYDYCITADNKCLTGPFTASTCSGQVSNTCPYGSSSSNGRSSSSLVLSSSSSSSLFQPSSSSSSETGSSGTIDGVWINEDVGYIHTVNGSAGVISQIYPTNALHTDALNKDYISIGSQVYRNLKSTGNLTWSGQYLMVNYNNSSPNVATGTTWVDCTLTLSADGQTIQFYSSGVTKTPNRILTRSNYSLDGVWINEDVGYIHTINGSAGVISQIYPTNALHTDALNKGYISIGSQVYRNLKSTGNLTWSGQYLMVNYNNSNPNVATSTTWVDCTLTLSADGQTLQFYSSGVTKTPNRILTRKQ